MLVLDVIRVISIGMMIAFVVIRVIRENSLSYITSLYGLLNLCVVSLGITSIVLSF